MNVQPRPQIPRQPVVFSPQRIFAMVLRYWYLLRSSWPRLLELIYWPAVQMLMWGFLQIYISQNAGFFASVERVLPEHFVHDERSRRCPDVVAQNSNECVVV